MPIDYNSHQILIDETGGDQPLSQLGVGGKLDVPCISLLLRPDGSVRCRNEAFDLPDAVRKDIEELRPRDRGIEQEERARERQQTRTPLTAQDVRVPTSTAPVALFPAATRRWHWFRAFEGLSGTG